MNFGLEAVITVVVRLRTDCTFFFFSLNGFKEKTPRVVQVSNTASEIFASPEIVVLGRGDCIQPEVNPAAKKTLQDISYDNLHSRICN